MKLTILAYDLSLKVQKLWFNVYGVRLGILMLYYMNSVYLKCLCVVFVFIQYKLKQFDVHVDSIILAIMVY